MSDVRRAKYPSELTLRNMDKAARPYAFALLMHPIYRRAAEAFGAEPGRESWDAARCFVAHAGLETNNGQGAYNNALGNIH
jgi:hypothetical protein